MEKILLNKILKNASHGQDDKPSESHLAFIPATLFDKVIELTSVTLNSNDMTTLILGIVCKAHTDVMFKADVKEWKSKFNTSSVINVQFQSLTDSPELLNQSHAIEKINSAMETMKAIPNGLPVRLILVGPGHTKFTYQAIKHLLKKWTNSDGSERSQKKLCFVISGDSPSEELFELCKELCLTGLCSSIQFYNTIYYRPFGYYNKPEYSF